MIAPKPTRRTVLFAGATVCAGAAFSPRWALAEPKPMSKEAVFFDPDAPVLGNPRGDVTLVEFFDYQCPYCKKSHPDVLRLVKEDGHIRHVMKDWPIFGKPSLYASRLVLAAGKDMAKARSALLATPGHLTVEQINETLASAGLDQKRLNAAYVRDKVRINALLTRNSGQAESFNLVGTPAYVIGTTLYPGVLRPQDMKEAVASARAG